MADYSIIKLSNLSPMHIGTGRENYDFSDAALHSDTLISALAAIKAQQGGGDNLHDFLLSFRLSSAFPYFKETLFLPTAFGKKDVVIPNQEEHLYRKALKKVKYAAYPIWERMVNGDKVTIDSKQIQGGFILEKASEDFRISHSQVNQRVFVPRDGASDSEPFFFEWMYYDTNAGLYVLTDATGELLEEVVKLFKLLGLQGVGTDKSVGGGQFNAELAGCLHINTPSSANAMMLLSLYIPQESELENICLEQSRYQIILRGGYIAGSQQEEFRHLRKKSIYMMSVGSVLKTVNPLEGKVVDLRPNWNDNLLHPVYRSGRALSIPIRISDYE